MRRYPSKFPAGVLWGTQLRTATYSLRPSLGFWRPPFRRSQILDFTTENNFRISQDEVELEFMTKEVEHRLKQ